MSDNSRDRAQIESILRKMELRRLSASSLLNSDELALLECYIEKNEQWVDHAKAEEQAHIQSQYCSPDGVNEYGMIAIRHFERRLRYSHVIYLTSVLDSLLEKACEHLVKIRGNQNLPFKAEDLKGERHEAQMRFLTACGCIDLPGDLVKFIEKLYALRRVIVVANGNPARLEKLMGSKWSPIPIDGIHIHGEDIEIGGKYIQAAIAAIREAAEHIEKGMRSLVDVSLRPRPLK